MLAFFLDHQGYRSVTELHELQNWHEFSIGDNIYNNILLSRGVVNIFPAYSDRHFSYEC